MSKFRTTNAALLLFVLILLKTDSLVSKVWGKPLFLQESSVTGTAAKDLLALAWMEGHWLGIDGAVETEELWLEPKGNTMLGLHRDVAGARTRMFEFLRIEATSDGVTYWASPRGRPATPFKLKEVSGQKVTFENPDHDFPQRVIYWLDKEGALCARIEGTMNGKTASQEWTWRRK